MATGVGAGAGIFRDDLFSDAYGVVCRIDHALTQADLPLSWEALEPWPFIANGLCEHISHERFQQVFKKSHLTVRNTTSLLALVRGGVGVTVLPRLVVNTDDPDGRRDVSVWTVARDIQDSRSRLGIQPVPASGTRAIAAASIVSATRSSGSRLRTWDLPQARARVWASSVRTRR